MSSLFLEKIFKTNNQKKYLNICNITNIIINSIAVLVSGILAGAGLSKLKTRSTKITYSTIVALYNIILSCILISDLCQRMGYTFDFNFNI